LRREGSGKKTTKFGRMDDELVCHKKTDLTIYTIGLWIARLYSIDARCGEKKVESDEDQENEVV